MRKMYYLCTLVSVAVSHMDTSPNRRGNINQFSRTEKQQNSMGLMEFLFGEEKGKKPRSGNWTDADDWNCGRQDHHDGMFGFDSYEENDF